MKCNEIRELLSLYIDQELEKSQIKAVEEHLAVCASCNKEYTELLEMVTLLREIDDVPVPDGFESRWKNALREEIANKEHEINHPVSKKDSAKKIKWRVFTSLAAVLAVGVISVSVYQDVIGDFYDKNIATEQQKLTNSANLALDDQNSEEPKALSNTANAKAKAKAADQNMMKSETTTSGDVVIENLNNSRAAEESTNDTSSKEAAFSYGFAGTAETGGGRSFTEDKETVTDTNADTDIATSRSLDIMMSKKAETSSYSNVASGFERNSAAVAYYSNLIEGKLEGFDYQMKGSSYVNGEWHFNVFIFHGKDGNTYNEDVVIVGKDGAIEVIYANEFMGLQ